MIRSVLRVLSALFLTWSPALFGPPDVSSQDAGRWGRVSVIQMPYTGARNVAELSDNPAYRYRHGATDSIRALGFSVVPDRAAYSLVDGAREGVQRRWGGR